MLTKLNIPYYQLQDYLYDDSCEYVSEDTLQEIMDFIIDGITDSSPFRNGQIQSPLSILYSFANLEIKEELEKSIENAY